MVPEHSTNPLVRPSYLDPDGMHIFSMAHQINTRETAILRLLGRLEYMTTVQIGVTAFADMSDRSVHQHLTRLYREGLVWRTKAPYMVLPPAPNPRLHPPLALPHVWGLTMEGKALLQTINAEPHEQSFRALKAREPKERPPGKLTLTHDLIASWWCTSLLLHLRRNAYVRSLTMQVEFTVHERQRMDALVIIRLTREPRLIDPTRWPFFDGTPRAADEIDIRLALEVDRGTEPLPILLAKGATYRDLHAQGTYTQALGGAILPVFLAPTARRAAQIAHEWREIWPGGWGVVATPQTASDPQHGTLWGQYRTLNDAQPFSLLTTIDPHPITNRVVYTPYITREAWAAQDHAKEQHDKTAKSTAHTNP